MRKFIHKETKMEWIILWILLTVGITFGAVKLIQKGTIK